jgi:hypothetical protein
MVTTDSSRDMQEQPPLARLFRTASLFCTRWNKKGFASNSVCAKLENLHKKQWWNFLQGPRLRRENKRLKYKPGDVSLYHQHHCPSLPAIKKIG